MTKTVIILIIFMCAASMGLGYGIAKFQNSRLELETANEILKIRQESYKLETELASARDKANTLESKAAGLESEKLSLLDDIKSLEGRNKALNTKLNGLNIANNNAVSTIRSEVLSDTKELCTKLCEERARIGYKCEIDFCAAFIK